MAVLLSDRAMRYLEGWRRVPQVATIREVRDALARAGVPAVQPFLDFHETFAGYVFDCVLEAGVLGLAYPEPSWQPDGPQSGGMAH